MAFSATVTGAQFIGPGRMQLSGTWSGAAGDAAGTLAVSGVVIRADFQSYDVDNAWGIPRISLSTTSGITTITVNNQDDVTTGYFIVDKLSS